MLCLPNVVGDKRRAKPGRFIAALAGARMISIAKRPLSSERSHLERGLTFLASDPILFWPS